MKGTFSSAWSQGCCPYSLPLTCLNISTQACTKTGPLLFCPPAKAGQSLCPLCQWLCDHLFRCVSILAAGAAWRSATWSGAWAGTTTALPSPCCPSCCPSCATAASRLRFDHARCVGWPLPVICCRASSISSICCSQDDFGVRWPRLITWLMFYNHTVCVFGEVLFWLAGPIVGDGGKLQGGRKGKAS